jgi:hypothetical protein
VICLAATVLLGSASASLAQPQPPVLGFPTWELTGGYQMLRVPDETFPFGLNVDGAWNLSEPLGLVAEIGFARKSEEIDDVSFMAWNFGAGPRWNLRRHPRLWPYAQVLGGFLHLGASSEIGGVDFEASDTRFMLQPGGGVNWVAGDGWGIVGAVDYRRVFLDEDEDGESGENEFRVFIGARMILD